METNIKINDEAKKILTAFKNQINGVMQQRAHFLNGLASGMSVDTQKYTFNIQALQFELIESKKEKTKNIKTGKQRHGK